VYNKVKHIQCLKLCENSHHLPLGVSSGERLSWRQERGRQSCTVMWTWSCRTSSENRSLSPNRRDTTSTKLWRNSCCLFFKLYVGYTFVFKTSCQLFT